MPVEDLTEGEDDMRRVVVTGMGTITPLGVGLPATWAGLIEGRSGTHAVPAFESLPLPSRIAGEAPGFDPVQFMDRKLARRCDRFTQFSLAVTEEALAQSGLRIEAEDPERVGVIIGSGMGGIGALVDQFAVLHTRGLERISPLFITSLVTNMAAGQISIRYGLQGPSFAVTSACATGAHAIGESVEIIRRGDADVMIAGGSEAPVFPISMAAFGNMHALSTRNGEPECASRPFDATRDGFVLGEGAGVVVLEAEEHAQARGATILAEVAGCGSTSDAYHVTAPSPGGTGAARAMRMALRKADVGPEEVDYINAHATATSDGDRAEAAAIHEVFGEGAGCIPVSSIKGATGHLFGASGTVEAIVCIQAIGTGIIPPTINYEHPDPECDLDVVPNRARQVSPIDVAISNSFGFGGHNVTLVLRRYAEL